jgi:hypothetical protein
VASDLPGSIGYVVPEATDDSVELVEESAATLTIENLTFLVSDDGLAVSGMVKLSGSADSSAAGIADLRLAVSYRSGDDQPWETVDESAACSFDSEFPLALEPSEAGADVAFECSLSRAVPAGAAVRVRAEALDYEGETAFQEVARGL